MKTKIPFTARIVDNMICDELHQLFQTNKTTVNSKAITTLYILSSHQAFIFHQCHTTCTVEQYDEINRNLILFSTQVLNIKKLVIYIW